MNEKEKNFEGEEINLLDYWRVVWKQRNIIIVIFIAVTLWTLFDNLRQPKIYQSTTSFLPPEIESKGGGSLSYLSQSLAKQIIPNLSVGNSTTNTIIAVLKSRKMAEDIIDNFSLKKLWEKVFLVDTIKQLEDNTIISISREGVIFVTVEATDKNLAADIANFYVANLNKINEELELSSAKPVVRILDVAKPAEKKSKPIIRRNVQLSAIAAFLLGILAAFLKEYIDRVKATGPEHKNSKRK